MIIPIACMNCGRTIADKWDWFVARVSSLRKEMGLPDQPIYIDGTIIPDTPENRALEELHIPRSKICCRKHFLTHRDLITNKGGIS